VDHDRHSTAAQAAAGGQIGGQGDVAAETDHDVGLDVVEHRARLPDGPAHAHREPDQVTRGLAGQRYGGDQFEVISTLGHQSGLQPALRAERRDPDPRIECHQGIGDGHRRLNVPRGASTCEYHGNPPVASLLLPGGNGGVVHP
jgi:hypothetical protein